MKLNIFSYIIVIPLGLGMMFFVDNFFSIPIGSVLNTLLVTAFSLFIIYVIQRVYKGVVRERMRNYFRRANEEELMGTTYEEFMESTKDLLEKSDVLDDISEATFNKHIKELQKELDDGGDPMEIMENDIALNKYLKKLIADEKKKKNEDNDDPHSVF